MPCDRCERQNSLRAQNEREHEAYRQRVEAALNAKDEAVAKLTAECQQLRSLLAVAELNESMRMDRKQGFDTGRVGE